MKKNIVFGIALFCFILTAAGTETFAQKVGFISSETVRQHFLEAKQAEQRIQSMVEDWKRELDIMQQEIQALEFEIEKNRLIWSDKEKAEKDMLLTEKKQARQAFAKAKFEVDGEYDRAVKVIMGPIEEKIYASVQEVAAESGYDIVWDQSTQPMPYVNFKYDLTVKVLRKLGVDVSELEKELREKIKNDPRNKRKRSYKSRGRSRSRSRTPDADRDVEREDESKPGESENDEKPEDPGPEGPGGNFRKKPPEGWKPPHGGNMPPPTDSASAIDAKEKKK